MQCWGGIGLAIWRVLRRHGLSRRAVAPRASANRYECAASSELVHLDIKRLARFWQIGKRALGDGVRRSGNARWQYLHLAVDDHSRYAATQLRPTQTGTDAAAVAASAMICAKSSTSSASAISAHAPTGHKPTAVRVGGGSVWGRRQARADAARV